MADLSDVMSYLAGTIAAMVYPNGTSNPSIAGVRIRVYPGWPLPNELETQLKAGNVDISIYPLGSERKKPIGIGRPYYIIDPGTPTITATVSGQAVTFSGTISVPQNIYLLINGNGYHHPVQPTDTLTSIATGYATTIAGATSAGPTLTVPSAREIIARVGAIGSAARELKRQEKEFQICVWAPTPALRDMIGGAIDALLSESSDSVFSDQSHGIVRYCRTSQTDEKQKFNTLYRRDVVYSVEYATTQIISAPQVVAPILNITDQAGNTNTIQE
ncbi:hypothetical protein [Serratia marcescens]|uniref:hypothetical protein n=1 Tax=Serratia marcescens TaxID=615 RepID=UPI0034E86793